MKKGTRAVLAVEEEPEHYEYRPRRGDGCFNQLAEAREGFIDGTDVPFLERGEWLLRKLEGRGMGNTTGVL